jgi:hypothetical protein
MNIFIWKDFKYSVEKRKWIMKLKIDRTLFLNEFNSLVEAHLFAQTIENNYIINGEETL